MKCFSRYIQGVLQEERTDVGFVLKLYTMIEAMVTWAIVTKQVATRFPNHCCFLTPRIICHHVCLMSIFLLQHFFKFSAFCRPNKLRRGTVSIPSKQHRLQAHGNTACQTACRRAVEKLTLLSRATHALKPVLSIGCERVTIMLRGHNIWRNLLLFRGTTYGDV